MKFSIINLNNVIISIVEADSISEIRKNKSEYNSYIIIPTEEHHLEGLDLNNYKPMSNKEKIEKGIIKLADNQIFDEENDYIGTAQPTEKIVNGQIVKKTYSEQFEDGIITEEEFLDKVNDDRQREYEEKVDPIVIEFMRSFLNNMDYNSLTDEQKELLCKMNAEVFKIKINNPK